MRGSTTVEFVTTAPARCRGGRGRRRSCRPSRGRRTATTPRARATRSPFTRSGRRSASSGRCAAAACSSSRRSSRAAACSSSQQHGRVFAIDARNGNVIVEQARSSAARRRRRPSRRDDVYVALMQPWPCRSEPRTQGGRRRSRSGRTTAKVLLAVQRLGRGRVVAAARRQPPLLRLVGPPALRARRRGTRQGALVVRRPTTRSTARPRTAAGWSSSAPTAGRVYGARRAHRQGAAGSAQSFSRFRPAASTSTPRRPSPTGASTSANTDGTLYAFGAGTGHLLWAQHAGTYVYTAPARLEADGLRRHLRRRRSYAFDAATGDAALDVRGAGGRSTARRPCSDGLVYFATCGTLRPARLALREARARAGPTRSNARTGKLVWTFPDGPVLAGRRRLEARLPRRRHARVYGLDAAAQGALGPSRLERAASSAATAIAGERPDEVRGLEDAGDEEEHEDRDREPGGRLPGRPRAALRARGATPSRAARRAATRSANG